MVHLASHRPPSVQSPDLWSDDLGIPKAQVRAKRVWQHQNTCRRKQGDRQHLEGVGKPNDGVRRW